MRSIIRKSFKRLHLYLALPAGLLVTLMCLTGGVMVFQTQIEEALYGDRYFRTEQRADRMDLDSLVEAVNAQLVADTVRAIKIAADPSRNVVATLSSGSRVYGYVNPSSAQIIEVVNVRSGFFHEVMRLHRWLMLPDRAVGRILMGGSTIALVVIIVTGLLRVFTARGSTRRKFSLRFRWQGANCFRKMFDLHKVLGIYFAALLLVMALTGLMWSFDWYRSAAADMLGVKTERANSAKRPKSIAAKTDSSAFWQRALDSVEAIVPDYQWITISQSGEISILPLDAAHSRAVDKYRFSRGDNRVVRLAAYGQTADQSYMMSQNYAIHVGSWGGLFTQILWFLGALFGAALPLTGYVLYFKHKS